jgi:hypothetical protein
MAESTSVVTKIDGSMDFSGGVDSIKVTTVQSQRNPNGLASNQLAWLNNGGVRDGGILPRTGWALLGKVRDGNALYNGGFMYEPFNANPYLVLNIGGETWQVLLDPGLPALAGAPMAAVNLTASFPGTKQVSSQQNFYVQGESYLIIQDGTLNATSPPNIWDGNTLRRSKGITNRGVAPGTPGVNEIPGAGPMDYYMGRIWYGQGRQYGAGDIVGGPSGVIGIQKADAILNVTEAPLVLGSDGFTVPNNAGNIRALFHNAQLNAQLGQGQLFIGTRKAVYALVVPVTRTDWIATTQQNQPQQLVVQLINGPVNDRSVVKVNGDVFYQSLEPSIRSLFASIRYFEQWGNVAIAANEQRILSFNDRSKLFLASGTYFDNRLLQTALPRQVSQGVVHDALIPMDFIPISSFGAGRQPIWQGMFEGLQILQLFTGDFGGRERSFAVVVSKKDSSFEIWELTDFLRTDFNDPVQTPANEARVTMVAETPAFTWADSGWETDLKKLVSMELMFDKLYGTVEITVEYRVDMDPCWKLWRKWKECSARNSAEDCANPITYPLVTYREGFRATRTLPMPPTDCEAATGRPTNTGYQFQFRITTKGWMRWRGIYAHAQKVLEKLYHALPPGC